MTYTVSSGTLNSSIPYHTIRDLSPFWWPLSRWTWVCRYQTVSITDVIVATDIRCSGDNWSCKTCKASGKRHYHQWRALRPSVLGQDRSENKKWVLVLQVWCCVVKHGLVMLVIIMILKDAETFQVVFIVSLFSAQNITTVEINSGVHLLKS